MTQLPLFSTPIADMPDVCLSCTMRLAVIGVERVADIVAPPWLRIVEHTNPPCLRALVERYKLEGGIA